MNEVKGPRPVRDIDEIMHALLYDGDPLLHRLVIDPALVMCFELKTYKRVILWPCASRTIGRGLTGPPPIALVVLRKGPGFPNQSKPTKWEKPSISKSRPCPLRGPWDFSLVAPTYHIPKAEAEAHSRS